MYKKQSSKIYEGFGFSEEEFLSLCRKYLMSDEQKTIGDVISDIVNTDELSENEVMLLLFHFGVLVGSSSMESLVSNVTNSVLEALGD
ncbi:MAG: hypothetical protein AB1695_14565 [Stygiobacter sp.]|jgi:hypothetical protein